MRPRGKRWKRMVAGREGGGRQAYEGFTEAFQTIRRPDA